MDKNVVILSFSDRNDGNCAKIMQHINNFYIRTNVSCFKITSEVFGPCGKCDYECMRSGSHCPNISEKQITIMDTICQSDVVYYIVPNYCGFPCANYFAFNERSVGYFDSDRSRMDSYMNVKKRFIIVSNSEGFEEALQQQTFDKPDILYLKSRAYRKQSIAGDLMESTEALVDLNQFLRQNTEK